jgi:hypothetical protein
MLVGECFNTRVPVKRDTKFRLVRRSAIHASHFEIQLYSVATRDCSAFFEKIDFITLSTTGMAFPKPDTILLPNRKRIASIFVKGAARTSLRMIAKT